ncbi:MAG: hypothetical protein ACJAWL_001270 [Motiliproteus sp.]|jgi:hypothetical protein
MENNEEKKPAPTVKWDGSRMDSTYANVCNVSSTQEEFTLLFGMNQSWNPEQSQLTIDLSDRIILNTFVAKRLAALLNNVVSKHEAQFGEINIERPEAQPEAVAAAAEEAEAQSTH